MLTLFTYISKTSLNYLVYFIPNKNHSDKIQGQRDYKKTQFLQSYFLVRVWSGLV